MKTNTQLVNDFQKVLEERSKINGEICYDYVAGFTLSMLKTLADISPKVEKEIINHTNYLKEIIAYKI